MIIKIRKTCLVCLYAEKIRKYWIFSVSFIIIIIIIIVIIILFCLVREFNFWGFGEELRPKKTKTVRESDSMN